MPSTARKKQNNKRKNNSTIKNIITVRPNVPYFAVARGVSPSRLPGEARGEGGLKLSAESGLCAHWHKPSSANSCPRALTAVNNLGRHLSPSATRPAHVCLTSIIFLSHTCVSSNTHAESQRRKPLALALSLAVASRPHRSAVFYLFISFSLLSSTPPSISLFFPLSASSSQTWGYRMAATHEMNDLFIVQLADHAWSGTAWL